MRREGRSFGGIVRGRRFDLSISSSPLLVGHVGWWSSLVMFEAFSFQLRAVLRHWGCTAAMQHHDERPNREETQERSLSDAEVA